MSNLRRIPKFLDNLWTILNTDEYNCIISWHQDPDKVNTFIIHDTVRFEFEILNRYYKHNSISSFYRSLNIYGFKRTKQADIVVISNPIINRFNKDSLTRIERKKPNDYVEPPLRRSNRLKLKRESDDDYYNFYDNHELSPPYDFSYKPLELRSEEATYLKSLITEEIGSVYKQLKKVTLENEILKNDNDNLKKDINEFKSNVYLFMNKLINKGPSSSIPNINPIKPMNSVHNLDSFNSFSGISGLNIKKRKPNEMKSLGFNNDTAINSQSNNTRVINEDVGKNYNNKYLQDIDDLESLGNVSVKKNKVIHSEDIKETVVDTSLDSINREAQVLRLLQSKQENESENENEKNRVEELNGSIVDVENSFNFNINPNNNKKL